LRKALICPLVFWGGCFWADHILPGNFRNDWARKALMWLQQIKEPHASLNDDPFFRHADELKLSTVVAESHDLELSIRIVDEYSNMGRYLDAAYIWIIVGDRAALETTSFRERYALTAASFGKRLAELFRVAGLERRASLVDNMLTAMERPEG